MWFFYYYSFIFTLQFFSYSLLSRVCLIIFRYFLINFLLWTLLATSFEFMQFWPLQNNIQQFSINLLPLTANKCNCNWIWIWKIPIFRKTCTCLTTGIVDFEKPINFPWRHLKCINGRYLNATQGIHFLLLILGTNRTCYTY